MTSRLWSCNSLVEAVPLLGHNSMASQPEGVHDVQQRIEALLLNMSSRHGL